MRTTVRLPDDLYRRAKARAADAGITFTQLLQDALRLLLSTDDQVSEDAAAYRIHPLERGDGLQPGADLSDQAALLDRMEGT